MPKCGGQATVFGGLPVWAEVEYENGDGLWESDFAIVDEVYWLKRNGQKGKPFSKKLWERLDKDKDWQTYVIEQVFDDIAYRQRPERDYND
jgi:hypothetical protein